MTEREADPGLAELVHGVAVLLQSVPPDQRPDGLDELGELLDQFQALVPVSEPTDTSGAQLEAARTTIEGLLQDLPAPLPSPSQGDPDPEITLRLVRSLAEAWQRRDGETVDRLVEQLEALSPAARADAEERKARIDTAVASSIAASLRRSGVVPSSDHEP